MRKGFANSTASHWNAGPSELTSSRPSKISKLKLILTRLNSSSAHPRLDTRAHLPITSRIKPPSTQEQCLFCSCGEILKQIARTSSLVTLSVYLQKTVGPSIVQNLSGSTCVNSVPLHWHFLFIVIPDYLNFHYPQLLICWCGYGWPSWPILPLTNEINKFTSANH